MKLAIINQKKGAKSVTLHDNNIKDNFINHFSDIARIDVEKQGSDRLIKIVSSTGETVIIRVNELNQMIGLSMLHTKEIGDQFLSNNAYLVEAEFPALTTVGNECLKSNNSIVKVNVPELITAGNRFIPRSKILVEADFPKLTTTGEQFISTIEMNLTSLGAQLVIELSKVMPMVTSNEQFLELANLIVGKMDKCQDVSVSTTEFIRAIETLESYTGPVDSNTMEEWWMNTLRDTRLCAPMNFPNLAKTGPSFMSSVLSAEVNCTSLVEADEAFMRRNALLERADFGMLTKIGGDFFGMHPHFKGDKGTVEEFLELMSQNSNIR